VVIVPHNRLRLLESGAHYFPALIDAIAAAIREIHLETYIFADDPTGRAVSAALAAAARRGVRVRVLVDGFGARDFAAGLGAELAAAGADVLVYRPEVARFRLRRHRLRRMHRKLVVIDARLAFVGGINIIDDLDTPQQIPPRYDYAVAVEGPLVGRIHAAARHLWNLVRWARLGRRPARPAFVPTAPPPAGTTAAAFLTRDNLRHRHDIENAYLAAIARARKEILIANAYFLPGRRFRQALIAAAQRGVRVVVLLQGRSEYLIQHHATRSLYGRLLAGGIEVWEYRRSFLHAKVAVIDGHWATIGSSNIDPFSLLLAREANLVVEDRTFAAELRASLTTAMEAGAHRVSLEDLQKLPWWGVLGGRLAYFLVRLAVGFSRRRGSDYTG
jgi:cardiolipin synthase